MQTLKLGSITIDRIVEIDTLYLDARRIYSEITKETLERHQPTLGRQLIHPESLHIGLGFHSYLIRTPGKTILVDTCNGNQKRRPEKMDWQHMLDSPIYLRNLARYGVAAEDVDYVLCTHLHTDHVGWNTILQGGRWTPTFRNARYLFAKREFDHFNELHAQHPDYPVGHGSFADSVLPILESGLADLVDMDTRVAGNLDEGVWLEPAPGHTPGHVTVHVRGGGQEAILTGDMIHHPIMFLESSLRSQHDADAQLADATRQRVLERLAGSSSYMLAAHFCSPTAGRVTCQGAGFKFQFLDR